MQGEPGQHWVQGEPGQHQLRGRTGLLQEVLLLSAEGPATEVLSCLGLDKLRGGLQPGTLGVPGRGAHKTLLLETLGAGSLTGSRVECL